jgi:hypothetical protein
MILEFKEVLNIAINSLSKSELSRLAIRYITHDTRKCYYFGCDEPICRDDKNLCDTGSWRLCQKHADERDAFIEHEDIRGLLGWWATSEYNRIKSCKENV